MEDYVEKFEKLTSKQKTECNRLFEMFVVELNHGRSSSSYCTNISEEMFKIYIYGIYGASINNYIQVTKKFYLVIKQINPLPYNFVLNVNN